MGVDEGVALCLDLRCGDTEKRALGIGFIEEEPVGENDKRAARRVRSTQAAGPAQLVQGGTRSVPPWLLDHRVELPDVVAGYVERPELERRCSPLARQLAVRQAPGGFGKTALLAQCCRQLREDRIPVA